MVVANKIIHLNDFINTAVFRVTDTACFLWQHMDDAHIIYDERSGHSQALNDFAYEILDIIGEKPCRLSDILATLARILERPLEEELTQQVFQTVAEFDKMGLIEPVKPSGEVSQ